jgi:hypothetical protein
VTFDEDVLAKLGRAETLPEAIGIAEAAAGSADKLGGMLGTTRQTVFGWKKGVFPTRYRDRLIAIGIPARLLLTVDKTAIEKRLRRVEAEVASIRRELG